MFRSKHRKPRAWSRVVALGLVALAAAASACSSQAEWEPRAGSLTLYASPYPPVAGERLVLGVDAKNVGPIEVMQGDELIAAFANTSVDGTKNYAVVAASSEIPRALAVGYDFRGLEVEARPFASSPVAPEPAPTPGTPTPEVCAGVNEATRSCSAPGSQAVRLEVYNGTAGSVSVYDRAALPPDSCFNDIAAIVPAGETRQTNQLAGNVIWFMDDRSASVIRAIELPAVADCRIVL